MKIVEIQFQKRKQRIFALDENYNVVASYPCRDDFFPGVNEYGQPRASLPIGTYEHVSAELGDFGKSYGTFYITTGDHRGRDIHGGGNGYGIPDPYAKRQGWLGTYGCLRMQNEDGEELSKMIIESGNDITLTVVK